jgi:uncharacterized protein YjbJ (UPF0337 family)
MNLTFSWRTLWAKANWAKANWAKAKIAIAASLIALIGWVSAPAMAQAAVIDADPGQSFAEMFQAMDDKAKSDLDDFAGSGTSLQLEAKIDRATGVVQDNLGAAQGNLGEQAKGSANKLKANVKEAAGRTAKGLDHAADDLGDSGEGLMERVKHFFD